jgi:hypothetical protein
VHPRLQVRFLVDLELTELNTVASSVKNRSSRLFTSHLRVIEIEFTALAQFTT